MRFGSRLPPIVLALSFQAAALLLALLIVGYSGWPVSPLSLALLVGGLAAAGSYWAGQPRWWLPIQLGFAPAAAIAQTADLSPTVYLAVFLLLLLVYWSTFRTQVPLYLSSRKIWQALAALLPEERPFTFMDLGSGIGGVLAYLSVRHPQGNFAGVEAAPLPWLWSRLRLAARRNCRVYWGSLWDTDLAQYDCVFAYLSPVPMAELWEKVRREMKPGSLFVSNTFAVPDFPPQMTVQVDDLHQSTLYIWRL